MEERVYFRRVSLFRHAAFDQRLKYGYSALGSVKIAKGTSKFGATEGRKDPEYPWILRIRCTAGNIHGIVSFFSIPMTTARPNTQLAVPDPLIFRQREKLMLSQE